MAADDLPISSCQVDDSVAPGEVKNVGFGLYHVPLDAGLRDKLAEVMRVV